MNEGCHKHQSQQMDQDFLQQIDQVKDLLPEPATVEKLDDEVVICECFCVNVKDIREACAAASQVDIRLLQERFSLGHGCQSCMKSKDLWVSKIF
jgi:NAD(P)H-nitrite reductase large subunit